MALPAHERYPLYGKGVEPYPKSSPNGKTSEEREAEW